MSAIRLGAAANVRDFQSLLNALSTHKSSVIDGDSLQDEFGRFRVWSGNLGALQKGHSSLDYRLRDAPLLSAEVLKLLKELEENLHAAHDIVTGVRLPYEQQQKLDDCDDEGSEDDFFSEDEDETSDSGVPRSELRMRYHEVIDIIDNLYKISVRIRTPTARTRSLKAATYSPKDPETGVDLLDQYAVFDLHHTQELVRHLRIHHKNSEKDMDTNNDLIMRLARGVTLRRRQFKYWRRHRDKLGMSEITEEPQAPAALARPEVLNRKDTLEVQPGTPAINEVPGSAPSQKTGKTLLSGTEATLHHQSLDEIVDSKSVTSYAVTVKDLSGKGIDLPPPPRAAEGDRDFECPYCFIICPARYGKGRPWRTHVLQDLQPYVCTYSECQVSQQLFRSRRDWAEHEGTHRKAWRCPEHPDAVYRSHNGLEEHLRHHHGDSVHENQLASLVKVGETNTVDQRQNCPICLVSADTEGIGTLQDHIANHLERIAAFSLPVEVDDDIESGGSSRASRGGSEGSELHITSKSASTEDTGDYGGELDRVDSSDTSLAYVPGDVNSSSVDHLQTTERPYESLTQALLHTLPDDSGHRTSLLLAADTENGVRSKEKLEKELSQATNNEAEEDMTERENLQRYLLSQPGAQSVSFDMRDGLWNGTIRFKDGEFASMALRSFDMAKYPRVRLRQRQADSDTLEFSILTDGQKKVVSFRSKVDAADPSPPASLLSESSSGDTVSTSTILTVADIPNLCSLYRSEEILPQDDQVYTSNHVYNEIVSLCYYDITRLEVDAIVNSCNRTLIPSRSESTLNSTIHKAAGPGLQQECSSMSKLESSQSAITNGHQLPCTHIIHVARPRYVSRKGIAQYDLLAESYRGALKLAMDYGLKSIAFCCLGTGMVGFPAQTAALVALQETRKFLENHQTHCFERIIFCVYTEVDLRAYSDLFPQVFPPTSGDLAIATSNRSHVDYARISALMQEVSKRINSIQEQLRTFDVGFVDSPQTVAQELSIIAALIDGFERTVFHQTGRLFWHSMKNVDLLCSVLLSVFSDITDIGHIIDIAEIGNGNERLGLPSRLAIWHRYDRHMQEKLGLNIVEVVRFCTDFAQRLNGILKRNAPVPQIMKIIGAHLKAWLTAQNGEGQSVRDYVEETLLSRQHQLKATEKDSAGTVKLHEIPTLTQLYDQGVLQPKSTQILGSARSNYVVCLTREDITRLEIDIIVNSTDTYFSGFGGLDRTVFRRGGIELENECANHAPCNEGEVILTGGYSLPVRHVLHAVPPAIYLPETKHVLRDMYRKILHMASYLKAKSIAIPSLGTGMLDYPRKDAAAVAIEEVKRFLESIDESNPIEKIVLVVFSPNDEFVYKSLIPVYFPAPNSIIEPNEPSSPPPRTILGSLGTLGDTFRKISSSKKRPVTPSKLPLEPDEEDVLIKFESHAQVCPTCGNMSKIYAEGKDLCDDGYRLAAQLLRHLHMRTDQAVYSLRSEEVAQKEVDVPDIFPLSLELLRIVEESFRDPDRDRPFVSNQPALGKLRRPEYTVYKIRITVSSQNSRERSFSRIHIWSDPSNGWESFQASEPTLHLTRGSLVIREGDNESISKALTKFYLNLQSEFSRPSATEILVDHVNAEQLLARELGSRFTLRFESQIDRDMLLTRLKHVAKNSGGYSKSNTPQPEQKSAEKQGIYDEVTVSPETEVEAHVSYWAPSVDRWMAYSHSAASFNTAPGMLEVVTTEITSASFETCVRLRLNLTPLTIIRRHSDLEILLDNVITSNVLTADSKRYMLKCSSSSDCDILLPRLTHAIETSSYEAGESSLMARTPLDPDSSDHSGWKEQLEAVKQLWKTDEEKLNEQSPMQSDDEFEDHLGKLHRMMNELRPPGSTESDTKAQIESSYPGSLAHRILAHLESLPQERRNAADELELAIELNESRIRIVEAVEHLRVKDLIEPVPERPHTWTLHKPHPSLSQDSPAGS